MKPMSRDFSTISPSAKILLLLKSLTSIPFLKEAVHLLFTEEEQKNGQQTLNLFGRLIHFENRYWSIDRLTKETGIKNIIEVSSGFSFRGLDKVLNENVYYIDTDLPDLITDKKKILRKLIDGKNLKGTLITESLNALNEVEFLKLVNTFPPGPICVVNEGLLPYLNIREKQELSAIIHRVLKERGGYWITADIYIKNPNTPKDMIYGQEMADFIKIHNMEENKFENYSEANLFFDRAGFVVEQTNIVAYDNLISLEMIMQFRQTWMLKIKN
jgi:O-methyltransferase involved in polyketide biosynthesis